MLTKPIGTGVVTTALKNGKAVGDVLDAAVDSMLRLNRDAAEAMLAASANAATDVTGFGIVGHLMTMMNASKTTGRLRRSALPVLPGVVELLGEGVAPGGTHRNLESCSESVSWDNDVTDIDQLLLCDPQTSGGLLISLPEDAVGGLIADLKGRGVVGTVVGEVGDFSGKAVEVNR